MIKCISTLVFLAAIILPANKAHAAGGELLRDLAPASQHVLAVPTTPECTAPCFWYGGERYRLTSYLVNIEALEAFSRDSLVLLDVFKPVLGATVIGSAACMGMTSCFTLGLSTVIGGGHVVASLVLNHFVVPEEIFTQAIQKFGRDIGPYERDRLRVAAIALRQAAHDSTVIRRLQKIIDILDQINRSLRSDRRTWRKKPDPERLKELQNDLLGWESPICSICIQSIAGKATLAHEYDAGPSHFFCPECAEVYYAYQASPATSGDQQETPKMVNCPFCRQPWTDAWEVPWPNGEHAAAVVAEPDEPVGNVAAEDEGDYVIAFADAVVAEPDEPFGDVATEDEASDQELIVNQPPRVRVYQDADGESLRGFD